MCTHLVWQALHRHGRGALNRVGHLEEVPLEVEVVDRAKRAQGVVPQAEVGALHLPCTLQREQQGRLVHHLGDAVVHAGDQQHVAVLDRRHVDEHQVGRGPALRLGVVVGVVHRARGELEQHLLHGGLLEVELAGVEGLHHLVHAELRGPLLAGTPLVELSNEAVHTLRDL